MSASTEIAPDAAGLRVARVELAAALRAAALYGFNEGIDNHFSLAVPGRSDCFLLNPYGPHWSELRASDLLTIGLGGERIAGEGRLDTTAFTIHLGAHRARPDAACVLHTHMPYATALAVTEEGFDTRASQNAARFHGGRYVYHRDYGGLFSSPDECLPIAEQIAAGVRVVLLRNHGVLVAHRDLPWMVLTAVTLERAVMLQSIAATLGTAKPIEVGLVHDLQRRKYNDGLVDEYWQAWVRDMRRRGRADGMES